ncbi:MAG: aspartate aminotransferase family protein [Desulfarculaceae bacterium]|nr:aspartate aminotransferase family protein [Desulfarculaceae bacterium]MCF8048202.1 aspartate aminotransferase family protein [Desulfarculaceae bacterium]MCF8096796.1 aspartate aminotransferase family protein [Desulfarculaceae bacterium]MCF8122612.1 aspartate aminotransferase family protein [Desulfarculaceae bacterium]
MDAAKLIDKYVMNTYGRAPITFVQGEGCQLWDDQGNQFTDFLAGIAVVNLGHAHPEVTKAVCEQAARLVHVSNLYYTEPQAKVAELLVENSFADKVFFCNSGAEANEGALKLARLWGKEKMGGAFTIITMERSFHGRTLGTLSATGQDKIQKGYDPLVPRFKHVPYGDLEAVKDAWDDNVCAVLVEPVLGEGGVVVPPDGYLSGLRELCDSHGALLMFDEVQTGLGRTGKLFAHEHFGVKPHVMTLAKALANGLPAGAVLADAEAAKMFGPGTHATTFGAGPVVMAASGVVVDKLVNGGLVEHAEATGLYFKTQLEGLAAKYPEVVTQVRGLGLLLGLALNQAAGPLVARLRDMGYIVGAAQDTVLRFAPPLVVSQNEIDGLVAALDQALAEC